MDGTFIVLNTNFLNGLFQVIGALGIMIYANYWFAVAMIPVIVLYLIIIQLYRSSNREMKRLESISRSPLCMLLWRY